MLFENIHILQPDGTILKNAYLQTKDKDIVYIGSTPPKQKDPLSFDGTNKLLRPGYINTHCHVPMTLLRSHGSDLPLARWLHEAIFPIEAKMTAQQCYDGALLGIAELLRCGVTSFTDMYLFGHACCEAVIDTGIKANISLGITCFDDTPFSLLPFVQETKEILQQYHNVNNGQLKIDAGLHGEYTSNPKTVASLAEFALENKLNIHLHLSETQEETQACIQRHGKTPTVYFHDLGIFHSPTTAAHCVFLDDNDREILAKNHVNVAHCPISNLKLGSGIADISKLLAQSINVTIGTDGTASNDNLNFMEDIKLAALLQKGFHRNPALLPVTEILKMATQNGAAAQNRHNTGKIEVGYRGDFAIVTLDSINLLSAAHIPSALIYASQPSDVMMTVVDGKILYHNGTFPTIDIEKVTDNVKKDYTQLYSSK